MKPKNILITGGCGFLGQYLTRDIINEFPNAKIKIIDLKSNPRPLFNFNNHPNVKISINKDICNYDSIKNEFKYIDTVIHLAGIVSFSLKDKELLKRVNIDGTRNIINAVNENNIKRFIHISSVAALGYNDKQHKPIDEDFKFNWNIAKKKKKYYMLTKHLADKEVKENIKNAIIIYPGLMLGPGDLINSPKLINAIKNKKIPCNMPGGTNLLDVRDISHGITKILKKEITTGEFLLSGHNLSMDEINKTIAEEFSVNPPSFTLPKFLNFPLFHLALFFESIAKNKLEVTADNIDSSFKFRYFDNTKAKNELDWEPKISFRQTIKDTIKWMNQNGYFKE